MPQTAFAGPHTAKKLEVVASYLNSFVTVLKKQRFETVYFDAFAGTGEIPVKVSDLPQLIGGEDRRHIVVGSVKRALEVDPTFDKYIFVEKSPRKAAALRKFVQTRYPALLPKVLVREMDASAALEEFIEGTDWRRTRAVIFLDPFGSQIPFHTVERIGSKTKADLWYLFPSGLGVHRQISRKGTVRPEHAASLDRLLGGREWEDHLISVVPTDDLFGMTEERTKSCTADAATEYMIEKMKICFGGQVLNEWLPLGSRGVHMYSLLFAWANRDPKAALASRLARAVLKSNGRNNGRAK